MSAGLSATMAIALGEARDHGGRLVYWRGGFWTYPNCAVKCKSWPSGDAVPEWSVGTRTVKALVARGELVFTDWNEPYRYPIAAEIPPVSA